MFFEGNHHYLCCHTTSWTESTKCIKPKIILQDRKYIASKETYGTDIPADPNKVSLPASYSARIHVLFTLRCNSRQKKVIAISQCTVSLHMLYMRTFSVPYASTTNFAFKVKTIGIVPDFSSINKIFKMNSAV